MFFLMAPGVYSTRVERSGVNAPAIADEAVRACGLLRKQLAAMSDTDAATISNMLNGQSPLDINVMALWGVQFWTTFIPKYVAALFAVFCQEVRRDMKRSA